MHPRVRVTVNVSRHKIYVSQMPGQCLMEMLLGLHLGHADSSGIDNADENNPLASVPLS
jgi:hypothetical protein